MQHEDPPSSDEEDHEVNPAQEQENYITDAQEFLDFCLKDKKIKVMDECNPILSSVYLKDISLHKKGPLEDKIYARVGKYYRNIRRGNTLCQIYHPDQINQTHQAYDIFFCRRGMKKFYDLEPEYLLVGANLSTHHRLMRRRIFESLEQELEQPNAQFHLYRLFKENGEHCQIGYVKQLDSWLFASKNVTILAKTPKDLEENYHKERFYWAKLIGEEFFRVLERFSESQRQDFKRDIDGFTLLGEHCGHEKHQHITKYSKVEIIFYGLVKNLGGDHCQSVEQCRSFLNKYGLKMSSCIERKGLTDKNTIYASMYDMLKEVAEGTMEKEGEGSVMYIVCERAGLQRTIGMCKLKTCEYLIYRRLREMLKLNVSKKGSTANNFEKFKYDIEQLVSHYFKPPKVLEFYFKLGEKAFQEAGSNEEISETYLRYKFVDFMAQFEQMEKAKTTLPQIQPKRIILICLPRVVNSVEKYCKNKEIEVDYMYRAGKPPTKNTLHILYMIPRLTAALEENTELVIAKYEQKDLADCISQLDSCKDLTKSHLITFIKSSDKDKSVRMLNSKINVLRESCIKQGIPFRAITPSEESIIGALRQSLEVESPLLEPYLSKNQENRKYVVIPLLIPGSGKSSLAKELIKSSSYDWKVIDSDKIRRELMENMEEVDLDNEKSQELFFKAKVSAQEQYKKFLAEQINQTTNKSSYLFIDRLFSPYNLNETIEELLKFQNQAVSIIVLTQSYSPVKLNDFTYPSSTNYLFTCLKRCLEREEHKTMPNDPYDVAKIVLRYYQALANFNEKVVLKLNPEKIQFVRLPFVEDTQSSIYPHLTLKRTLQQCLKLIEPGKQAKDSNIFISLIEQLYKYTEIRQEKGLSRYSSLRLALQREMHRSQ